MGGDNGRDNPNEAIQARQRRAEATAKAEAEQKRWESEQARIAQERATAYSLNESALQETRNDALAQSNRFQTDNAAQQGAIGATGGTSGAKGAATMATGSLNLSGLPTAADPLISGGGATSLASLMKKRNSSQSNIIGTGNSLNRGGAILGG